MAGRGESGPISPSMAIAMVIAGLFAMAILNGIEIIVLAVYTFKRYTGLYFWSILVADVGMIFYTIANLLRLFGLVPNFPISVVLVLTWCVMVTGQSAVLYSRLHLVTTNRLVIRWVLTMIITNVFVIHVPVIIVWLGCQLDPDRFLVPFDIWERIQLVVFSLQEFTISAIYIWEAGHGLKLILATKGYEAQNVTRELILINALIILFDVSLCITEFTGHLYIQTSYQPFIYSVKLKLEFFILNKLLNIIQQPQCRKTDQKYLRNRAASMSCQSPLANTRASGTGL